MSALEIPPQVYLVIIGVLLLLAGIVLTPVDPPLGNAAFWLGVILLVIGIGLIIAELMSN